jgi:hypothetical protein
VQADVLDEAGRSVRDQVGELAVLAPFVGMTRAFWQDRERYLETYWSRFPGVWVHGDLAGSGACCVEIAWAGGLRRDDGCSGQAARSTGTGAASGSPKLCHPSTLRMVI